MEEIETLISAWMEWCFIQKGNQARGVGQSAYVVRSFIRWLTNKGFNESVKGIVRSHIEEWQKSLYYDQGNISNQTRASKLSALRSFFGWLKYAGHLEYDPTNGIPTPKIKESDPQKFSTTELRQLFAAPKTDELLGLRDLTVLKTLYATGARVSELCSLEINHLSDTGKYMRVRIVGGKGNKDRTITLEARAAKTLREWQSARYGIEAAHNFLFVRLHGGKYERLTVPSVQAILKKYAATVGIKSEDAFIHKMRGTYGSDLYDSGDDHCPRCKAPIRNIDLLQVQLSMGHNDPKTTLRYIAISDRHLRKTAIPDRRFREIEEG